MECRPLEVTLISAMDLEDVRMVFNMHPYVVAFLSSDESPEGKQRTPVHEDGGTSPRWDHALTKPFIVDVAAARAGHLILKLEIKTRRTAQINKHVGWVNVPVRELLEQGGDGEPTVTRYAVRLPSGETRGFLQFSYKFGEAFTVHGAEPHQPQRPGNQQPPKPGWNCFRGVMVGAAVWDGIGDGLDL